MRSFKTGRDFCCNEAAALETAAIGEINFLHGAKLQAIQRSFFGPIRCCRPIDHLVGERKERRRHIELERSRGTRLITSSNQVACITGRFMASRP